MQQARKYTRTFEYDGRTIEFHCWNIEATDRTPDTIVFLGAGQVGRIPRWVALSAGPGVVVVEGLPHWEAHPSGHDTAEFAALYAKSAFLEIQKIFGITRIHLIAESQAAPASVLMALAHSDYVENIVLVRPLGFSAKAFGQTEQERLKVFGRRAFRTILQLMRHPRNVAIGIIMLRAMLRESSFRAFISKYAKGISYDALQDYVRLLAVQKQKGHTTTLLLGEKDWLFPPREVLSAFSDIGLEEASVVVVPKTGHASFATPSSGVILQQALALVRQK